MSEFVEVMKQRERICEFYDCENCPISSFVNRTEKHCSSYMSENPQEAEEIIMKWAKEHPIMTNGEKFKEIMLDTFGVDVFPNRMGCQGVVCPRGKSCNDCEYNGFWGQEYKENK